MKKRVASFDKAGKVYKPVNKRAKAYAAEFKVKTLTVKQLHQIKEHGKHRVVVYDSPLSTHFTEAKV